MLGAAVGAVRADEGRHHRMQRVDVVILGTVSEALVAIIGPNNQKKQSSLLRTMSDSEDVTADSSEITI